MVVKTTVSIDEETLREFRKVVASRYGSTRKLSVAIEEAIRSFNTSAIVWRRRGIRATESNASRFCASAADTWDTSSTTGQEEVLHQFSSTAIQG